MRKDGQIRFSASRLNLFPNWIKGCQTEFRVWLLPDSSLPDCIQDWNHGCQVGVGLRFARVNSGLPD